MIRRAEVRDRADLVRMARDFQASLPQLAGVPFSTIAAGMAADRVLTSPRALCLVCDLDGAKGCLIAEEMDWPLGAAVITKEAMFWIDPDCRGRWALPMLRAYVEWARSRGAALAGMTCFNDGRTARLMERAGFKPTEITFSMGL